MAWSIRNAPRPSELSFSGMASAFRAMRGRLIPAHIIVSVWTAGLSVEFAWILPAGDNYTAMEHLLMGDIAQVELALQDEWLRNERAFAAMRRAAYEKRRMEG